MEGRGEDLEVLERRVLLLLQEVGEAAEVLDPVAVAVAVALQAPPWLGEVAEDLAFVSSLVGKELIRC
jgi:hypothetical protein